MQLVKLLPHCENLLLIKEIYWQKKDFIYLEQPMQFKKGKERIILHLHSINIFLAPYPLCCYFLLQSVSQLYDIWLLADATLHYEDIV